MICCLCRIENIARSIRVAHMLTVSELIRSKIFSSSVALFGILFVYFSTGNPESIFNLLILLVLPLACIWYPDELGTVTGISLGIGRPQVSEPTPGIAISIGGWILMLTIVVVAIVNC